jgi:NADH-quinone oxidoreductase subunit E
MLEHACKRLRVSSGQTTSDGKLTLEFAECLGVCDFAPAAVADDGRVFGPLTAAKVESMVAELAAGPRVQDSETR